MLINYSLCLIISRLNYYEITYILLTAFFQQYIRIFYIRYRLFAADNEDEIFEEGMSQVVIKCNIEGILSAIMARRILSAIVILFVLLCPGMKDVCVFAQTPENETDRVYDETSDKSQAIDSEELPLARPSGQDEPRIIDKTVDPVTESWEIEDGFGNKIDWMHDKLYEIAQTQVEWVDSWFISPRDEKRMVAPSRFRVGFYGEGKIQEYKDTEVKPVVDLDAEVELPNLEHRMKLIITTSDPTTLPGKSFIEQLDKSLRTVLVRQWLPDMSTAVGVRLRWKPELFAYALWTHDWKAGNWLLYPQEKIYWENKDGLGEISTLVLDHWISRWNTRFSTSNKWSKQDRDDDQKTGREDNGFRWSEVFLLEYAKELLDESRLGRVVSGDDIARGWGMRLSAFGGFHFIDEYRAGVFYRWPLRKKWIYSFAGPEIKWKNENNWDQEWTVKCGIEMLFWGGKER